MPPKSSNPIVDEDPLSSTAATSTNTNAINIDIDIERLKRDVDHASSIDDLRISLQQVRSGRSSLENSLQRYVSSSSVSHSNQLRKLNLIQTQLGSALSSSHDLLSSLSSASFVASSLAVKVRRLDLEQSRVKEALQYVKDVIELKQSVQGVHYAMDTRDWERAAKYVHKARVLPEGLIDGSFAKYMVPSAEFPDFPKETLEEASKALGTIFLREFNKAANEKNMEMLTKYFKLFPLIGQENEGLSVYAKFICGIITAQSRERIQNRSMGSSSNVPMFYAVAVTRLFENIAAIVNQHAPIVERHYGKGRMANVLDKTQDEADSQGGLIIDTLWDERNIPRVLLDIQNYAFPYLVNSFAPGASGSSKNVLGSSRRSNSPGFSSGSNSGRNSSELNGGAGYDLETIDLKHVGNLIRELSVILNRWSLYRNFIGYNWTEYSGEVNISSSGTMHMPQFLVDCSFQKKVVSKIQPAFQSMATFAFRRSLEKALQLEEIPSATLQYTQESPLVTSLVEDCMYILKIILQQTVDSGEVSIIKHVVAAIRRILESDLVGAMQRKLRDEAPRAVSATATFSSTTGSVTSGIVSRLSSSTPPPGSNASTGSGSGMASGNGPVSARSGLAGLQGHEESRLRNFLIYLNNLYVSGEYTERIVKDLSYQATLPYENDAEDVKLQLDAFVQSFKHRCDELINDGVQVAFTQVMSSRIRHLVNNLFKDNDYMVSATEVGNDDTGVSAYGSDSVSVVSTVFTNEWSVIKNKLSTVMAPSLYTKLLSNAVSMLSKSLEKRIWAIEGKVNELGAIKLDRDISRIIAQVSSGQYTLRSKFVRVAQLVMIIGLEDIDEEEGIDWVLSDSERQRARFIRVERRELNY